METHNHDHGSDGYDLFLRIFTQIAGWVVAATAVYMLFGLFSQFIGVNA